MYTSVRSENSRIHCTVRVKVIFCAGYGDDLATEAFNLQVPRLEGAFTDVPEIEHDPETRDQVIFPLDPVLAMLDKV